jgi:hypothetical protein
MLEFFCVGIATIYLSYRYLRKSHIPGYFLRHCKKDKGDYVTVTLYGIGDTFPMILSRKLYKNNDEYVYDETQLLSILTNPVKNLVFRSVGVVSVKIQDEKNKILLAEIVLNS